MKYIDPITQEQTNIDIQIIPPNDPTTKEGRKSVFDKMREYHEAKARSAKKAYKTNQIKRSKKTKDNEELQTPD